MSYRRRQQRILMANVDPFYEAPGGNMEAWSGEEDLDFPTDFPGPREDRFVDAENYVPFGPDYAIDSIRDNVQWDIGGIIGQTKNVGSTGVTDPQTVDAHSFTGQMAVIRRMPDTNYGPVKTSDHNSLLSLLYAMQEGSHYFPNEASQIDVIKAV